MELWGPVSIHVQHSACSLSRYIPFCSGLKVQCNKFSQKIWPCYGKYRTFRTFLFQIFLIACWVRIPAEEVIHSFKGGVDNQLFKFKRYYFIRLGWKTKYLVNSGTDQHSEMTTVLAVPSHLLWAKVLKS